MDGDDDDNEEKTPISHHKDGDNQELDKSKDNFGGDDDEIPAQDDEIPENTADTLVKTPSKKSRKSMNKVPALPKGHGSDKPEKKQYDGGSSRSIPSRKSMLLAPTTPNDEVDIPADQPPEETEEIAVGSTYKQSRKSVHLFTPPPDEDKTDIPDTTPDQAEEIVISHQKQSSKSMNVFTFPDEDETESPEKLQDDTLENVASDASIAFWQSTKFVPVGDEADNPETIQHLIDTKPSRVIDVLDFIPPEALKTVKVRSNLPKKKNKHKIHFKDKADGPIASKVVYLKLPEELLPHEGEGASTGTGEDDQQHVHYDEDGSEAHSYRTSEDAQAAALREFYENNPMHLLSFLDNIDRFLKETKDDEDVENKVNHMLDRHREEQLRKLRSAAKGRSLKVKFGEMVHTLHKLGIPTPSNDDAARLHGSYNRWDPDGTIVEYFSPMLRSYIPINMRGRYRGCWKTDTCMKGVNISKLPPKRDAPEGFVERGRHSNIQQRYDEMSSVASDEAHLDYLIEMQAFQAETLPIPIFYNMLHLGMQVANETLRILVQEEGYPPSNEIFGSQLQHAEQLRRKIQMYGALGLETLESKRKGLGEYLPHWLKSRDEIIRDIMAARDAQRYDYLERNESEIKERETMRRLQKEKENELSTAAAAKKVENAAPLSTTKLGAIASIRSWVKSRENKVAPEK